MVMTLVGGSLLSPGPQELWLELCVPKCISMLGCDSHEARFGYSALILGPPLCAQRLSCS